MADNSSEQPQSRPKGFSNLVRHMTTDYLGVGLWLTRIITIVLALFGYILPLLGGFFGDPVACCKLLFFGIPCKSWWMFEMWTVNLFCLTVFCQPHVGGTGVRGDTLSSVEN